MKNKTLKNLIFTAITVFMFVGFNHASAYYYNNYSSYMPSVTSDNYNQYNNGISSSYYNNSNIYSQNSNLQNSNYPLQPYYYTEPQKQTVTQIQYVPQIQYVQQPVNQIQYVPVSNQTASVVKTVTAKSANQVNTLPSSKTSGTGNYINYDANNSLLGASAYQSGVLYRDNVPENNGLTALSLNGSGSFMPSSVFQWFIVILLILAIIIISRILIKSFSHDNHVAPVH